MGQKGFLGNDGLPSSFVVIGQIGAPFGIKGWTHVHSFMNPPDLILAHKDWYLEGPVQVLEIRPHGKKFIALLADCQSRDDAQKWTNIEIKIPKASLPPLPLGEYYWSDLIGLQVFLASEISLGVIESLFATGSNDVIVVKGLEKTHLIPYIPETVIQKIDLKTRKMWVAWDTEF
jgi:16S rRNA processing protein RimM